eukprot:325350-Chlamydomonas_euryale.AAC.1
MDCGTTRDPLKSDVEGRGGARRVARAHLRGGGCTLEGLQIPVECYAKPKCRSVQGRLKQYSLARRSCDAFCCLAAGAAEAVQPSWS